MLTLYCIGEKLEIPYRKYDMMHTFMHWIAKTFEDMVLYDGKTLYGALYTERKPHTPIGVADHRSRLVMEFFEDGDEITFMDIRCMTGHLFRKMLVYNTLSDEEAVLAAKGETTVSRPVFPIQDGPVLYLKADLRPTVTVPYHADSTIMDLNRLLIQVYGPSSNHPESETLYSCYYTYRVINKTVDKAKRLGDVVPANSVLRVAHTMPQQFDEFRRNASIERDEILELVEFYRNLRAS